MPYTSLPGIQQFIGTILKESGGLVLDQYGDALETKVKADQTQVVTEVDIASEKLITERIQTQFPEHAIVAEESGFQDKKSEYLWIIDPIDGTSNFAKGLPWFGVMLALLHSFHPIASGIYLPVTDELYLAEKGKGAYKNGQQFHVAQETLLKDCLVSYCVDASEDTEHTKFLTTLFSHLLPKVRNLRATNSAVDYAYAAEGKLGALLNFNNKIWDVAALTLLAEEAGCHVSDLHGNALDLVIDKDTYMKNFSLVVANPAIHTQILDLIARSS